MLAEREQYVNKLKEWKDHPTVKVVTGIRGSGKSVLLAQYQNWLKTQNISDRQILSIDLEHPDSESLLDPQTLYEFVCRQIDTDQRFYVFLDEARNCPGFEQAVAMLADKDNLDLYLCGSTGEVLCTKLKKLLSGRYVHLPVLPLSYSEFAATRPVNPDSWQEYFAWGGFSQIHAGRAADSPTQSFENIYCTILVQDIFSRQQIQNYAGFLQMVRQLLAQTGQTTNPTRIACSLSRQGCKTTMQTIQKYIKALEEAFVIFPIQREDLLRGHAALSFRQYYPADVSFLNYLTHQRPERARQALKTIVFLELVRRGYDVKTGVIKGHDVDFVARKGGQTLYIQAIESTQDPVTYKEAVLALRLIQDACPKHLISLDETFQKEIDIAVWYAADFLQDDLWNRPVSDGRRP